MKKDKKRDKLLVNLAVWTIAIVGLCICFFFCGYIFNVDAKSTETYVRTDIKNKLEHRRGRAVCYNGK